MKQSLVKLQEQALRKRLQQVRKDALTPPPQLSLSEWAEQYLYLSPEASALPGKFRFERAPFQRGVFDALTDPKYSKVVIMAASQLLKTQALLSYIGYIVHLDPAPILVVQPTGKQAQSFSKDRVDTMLRDVPELRGKVRDKRRRDSGNTTLHKLFPGGALTIATSNSPSDLAARPIRYLLCDETDRYEPTAEGDPIEIAQKRTTTFWNSKQVYVSSPGDDEISRIALEYERSDKRIFMVPCHECGHEQQLNWANVKWEADKPRTAKYECEHCQTLWNDVERVDNIARGEWQVTNPSSEVAGFHISAIYSSFKRLGELAQEFLDSKSDPEQLKVFVNTRLAQTWKSDTSKVSDIQFANRLEDYTPQTLPNQVTLITAGVDVQVDRLEAEIVGWGVSDESWSIDYLVFNGDPTTPAPWTQLETYLETVFKRQDGIKLKLNATCIDTGGTATQDVFTFAKKMRKKGKNVYPIKGVAGPKPLFPQRAKRHKYKGSLFHSVGVDTGKEKLYQQLMIDKPGPGYCHFPIGYDDFYFDGIRAEKCVVQYKKGKPTKRWILKPGVRNEPLDCRVYAMAARYSFNIDIGKRQEMLAKKAEELAQEDTQEEVAEEVPTPLTQHQQKLSPVTNKPPRRSPRGGGYISGIT